MKNLVVELSILLNHDLQTYKTMLENINAVEVKVLAINNRYWANEDISNFNEQQLKDRLVRFRTIHVIELDGNPVHTMDIHGSKNLNAFNPCLPIKMNFSYDKELELTIEKIEDAGWKKIITVDEIDHHFKFTDDDNRFLYLQDIKNVGLVLKYKNMSYCGMDANEQKRNLIHELHAYGFHIDYERDHFDKLRTIYELGKNK